MSEERPSQEGELSLTILFEGLIKQPISEITRKVADNNIHVQDIQLGPVYKVKMEIENQRIFYRVF